MTTSTKATEVAASGSETKQGEGWWMASDRRWYPPELHHSYSAEQAEPAASTSAAEALAGSAATATPDANVARTTAPSVARSGPENRRPESAQPLHILEQTPTPKAARAPHPGAGAQPGGIAQPTVAAPVVVAEPERPNFVAGIVALSGAAMAILGSILPWASSKGSALADVGEYTATFAGFDSNGKWVLGFGLLMAIFGILLLRGFALAPSWTLGVATCVCGAVILASVLYGYLDVTGKASESWARLVAQDSGVSAEAVAEAGIGLKSSIGLWLAGWGGLLGLLTPPFVRRNAKTA